MSDKFKNSKFYRAMKNPKVSRAIYITLVLLLITAAVVIGIVSAANRAKKNKELPKVTTVEPSDNRNKPSTPGSVTTQKPAESKNPSGTNNPSDPVSVKLPSFGLPAAGKLAKGHDASVQVFSNTLEEYRVHLGLDIATAAGAPVYAAADGTVSKVWSDPMMGYCIAITHSGNSVTVYKNLAKELPTGIAEGGKVKAGQQIASVGESALVEVADEPHLHYEMTVGGVQVNPLEYFSTADRKTLNKDTATGE